MKWAAGVGGPPMFFSLFDVVSIVARLRYPFRRWVSSEQCPLFNATLKLKEILLRQICMIRYFEKQEKIDLGYVHDPWLGATRGWDEGRVHN